MSCIGQRSGNDGWVGWHPAGVVVVFVVDVSNLIIGYTAMKKRFLMTGVACCVSFLVWLGANGSVAHDEDVWVASVGPTVLHLSDYRDAYRDYILSTGLPDLPKRRADFLERMVSMRLLALDAKRSRLDSSQAFVAQLDRARQKLMIEGYVTTHVLSPIRVTEEEMREMFLRVNTRWTASHLFAETREEAEALEKRLAAGETFEDLATEIFSDTALKESGGLLGEFGFDEMDRAFEDAVFRMQPGEVSRPVRTAQGYSIIRLEDTFTQPILTESEFAQRKQGLSRYVLVRKHEEARDALRSDILQALAIRFDDGVLKALLGEIIGSGGLADGERVGAQDVLLRYEGGAMTTGAFMAASEHTSEAQRAAVVDLASLKGFIQGLLIRQEIIRRAESAGVPETSAFATALRRAEYDLLYEFGWNHLEEGIVIPDDSVAAHMARFPDEFRIPVRLRVREILLSSASEATALAKTVTPANFAELASKYSIRDGASSNGGDLGYVTREQLGQVAPAVFETGVGSIAGPLAVGGRYVLFLVTDRSEERAATLQEGRERVEGQLRAAWMRREVRETVTNLRDQFPVEKRLELLDDLALRSTDVPTVVTSNP